MPDSAQQPFTLPPLPWSESALSPVISKNTIELHYGKHHAGYVKNLNGLVAGTDMADMSLEELVRSVRDAADKKAVFNNAGQVWNHTFFWNCLASEPSSPSQALLDKLNETFGGIGEFQAQFAKAAAAQFGSGWAWLTSDGGKLAIETTANADTPMARSKRCLLTVDVWEHAYYLDYQNRRPDYLKAVIEQRLNWRFASDQYESA
jgi:superoxide dismutase, Fe-Mn family